MSTDKWMDKLIALDIKFRDVVIDEMANCNLNPNNNKIVIELRRKWKLKNSQL